MRAPPIACFWSFKGGVGRTLALVGVATTLARQGRRVLVVDADLEAPGITLSAPFRDVLADRPGFLEVLLGEGVEPVQVPAEKLPPAWRPGGALYAVGAGRLDGGHAARLDRFSLADHCTETHLAGFFDRLARWLRRRRTDEGDRFDLVLVDLRTGLHELSSQRVPRVADLVVVVSALNHQNIEGSRRFVKAVSRVEQPPALLRVASPVPLSEEAHKRRRLAAFAQALGGPPDARLHYHPALALTFDLGDPDLADLPLHAEHRGLARAIRDRVGLGPEALATALLGGAEPDREPARVQEIALLDAGRIPGLVAARARQGEVGRAAVARWLAALLELPEAAPGPWRPAVHEAARRFLDAGGGEPGRDELAGFGDRVLELLRQVEPDLPLDSAADLLRSAALLRARAARLADPAARQETLERALALLRDADGLRALHPPTLRAMGDTLSALGAHDEALGYHRRAAALEGGEE